MFHTSIFSRLQVIASDNITNNVIMTAPFITFYFLEGKELLHLYFCQYYFKNIDLFCGINTGVFVEKYHKNSGKYWKVRKSDKLNYT